MIRFFKAAGVVLTLAVVSCLAGTANADYRFDDLLGPSGRSYQWMIINDSGNTFGDSHLEAIDVSADVLTTDSTIINVLSGQSEETITDRSLHTLFFVTANGEGEFTMNFRALTLAQQFDIATPNLQLSTPYDEQETTRRLYIDTKTSAGQPTGKSYYNALWRSYNFYISRLDAKTDYDTVAQYFYFQQNPTELSSQGIPRPFVIANVYPGTAADDPYASLELRLTLRDGSSSNANIVAYDKTRWAMTGPITAGGQQWVFVPVDDLDVGNTRINYYLTTEVVNHCAVRYAAYDGSTNNWLFPNYWKFDMLRLKGNMNIDRQVSLAPASHIAPGLVAVYRRTYNVNETSKVPLRLFAIDDTIGTGVYALTLNHRIIYGKRLGSTYTLPSSEGNFNQVEVTAFQPRPGTGSVFYDNIARLTGSAGTVASPTTNIFTASSVKRDASALTSRAEQYFTIDQTIPSNLRTSSTEGVLPLHITFNLPATRLSTEAWNTLLRESRRSTNGNINDSFSEYYHIYAMVQTDDGKDNPWDLTEELMKHDGQLKVFIDEDRGRITQDTDRGVVTASFMLFMMNGTRDGSRPMITYTPDVITVPDAVEGESVEYVVVRDGSNDSKWNMTFFLAPPDYFTNPDQTNTNTAPVNTDTAGSSSGGGGCAMSGGIFMVGSLFFMVRRKHS